jgi:ketosteroid isomerase-like protein
MTTDAPEVRVDLPTIRRAMEGGDASLVVSLYADDAEMRIVDKSHTPSDPMVLRGKEAIRALWDDVCSRAMTHELGDEVVSSERIAFTEACRYEDGVRVLSANLLDLRDGRIARHTLVQAWDEPAA